ncbi:hypothetical protein ZOD2009_01385 [Haladaptatus paucihalophilus DX253]|uniref:DUF4352 domain-containing protein n=1 Tax=Haladaptatus paucihalophilus DX253 TaxID=797209 RepID=E7QMV9_HALPU|nr:twin-arginine translocation signal domain-containing protein [Haladaptatus paucihalophilus]EFW93754.1 hypothetical protein ZOD2009_01385 [Haladaptatus paucihalophilus DX253]SHL49993.1 protein of unknown function [Haladaptatus paucihalophilus DX253]
MRRRRFLLTSGATLAGGALAGCTGSEPKNGGNGDDSTTNETSGSGMSNETTTSGGGGGGKTTVDGFQLVSTDVPKQVTMGQQFSLSLTLKNVGDEPKAFQSSVQVDGNSPGAQQTGQMQTDKIDPGKTTKWSTTLTYPYVAKVNYRIEKLDETFTIDIVGEKLSFGETFRSPTEVAMTIQDITLTDHYRYEPSGGGSENVEASDGRQWAFVTVKAENKFRMKQTLPKGEQIHLIVGGDKVSMADIAKEDGKYEVNRFGDRTVASGESLTGWLAYEISADTSVDDLTVEWKGSDGNGSWWARWSQ